MDTKQVADTLAMLQADVNNMADLHGSDFMYFSQWLQELDKKVRTFESTLLKLEKTNQFADAIKAATPPVQVQKLPKVKIALAIGVGVYVGIKVNESLKPKKGQ